MPLVDVREPPPQVLPAGARFRAKSQVRCHGRRMLASVGGTINGIRPLSWTRGSVSYMGLSSGPDGGKRCKLFPDGRVARLVDEGLGHLAPTQRTGRSRASGGGAGSGTPMFSGSSVSDRPEPRPVEPNHEDIQANGRMVSAVRRFDRAIGCVSNSGTCREETDASRN